MALIFLTTSPLRLCPSVRVTQNLRSVFWGRSEETVLAYAKVSNKEDFCNVNNRFFLCNSVPRQPTDIFFCCFGCLEPNNIIILKRINNVMSESCQVACGLKTTFITVSSKRSNRLGLGSQSESEGRSLLRESKRKRGKGVWLDLRDALVHSSPEHPLGSRRVA